MTNENESMPATRGEDFEDVPRHDELEKYGGGHITSHHGRIDAWLLVVYVILFAWALYYGYKYWGGLGPGLDYSVGGGEWPGMIVARVLLGFALLNLLFLLTELALNVFGVALL